MRIYTYTARTFAVALVAAVSASAFAKADGRAQSYLERALQEAKTSSPSLQTNIFLRQIALAQARLGDGPAALRIADPGMGDDDRDKVYAELARIQAQGGDIDGALHTAEGIKSAYDRDRTTATIVKVQCKAEGIAAAERTVQHLPGDSAKAEALLEIAGAQAQSHDMDAAVHTVAAIRKLENWPYNTTSLAISDIAKTEVLAGDVSAGLRRAKDIPDFFRKEAALEASGVALAVAGNVPAALRFAHEIRNVAGDKDDAVFYATQRRQRNDSEVNVLCAIGVGEIRQVM